MPSVYTIKCKDFTREECDFVSEGGTPEETKEFFYAHIAESPVHEEKYYSASDEEKEALETEIDEHLEKQE